MITSIAGKRILLFSPAFFSYEQMIMRKMEELGATVDYYNVRSVTKAYERALLKISPRFFSRRSKDYYDTIIKSNSENDYDYILIIKCDMTPKGALKKLREVFPHAKMCLYLWDSISNIPDVKEKFKYFDTLHSFDLNDCKSINNLQFRPLFFCDDFRRNNQKRDYKYDISFLGTIHSDRFAIIKQIQEIIESSKLKGYWYLYLQSRFIYYFYKITKKEFRNTSIEMFEFKKKSTDEIATIIDESKVVLDIQHPKQTGLTMRTIEVLGMNKKLITTNQSIREYDFFCENNVAVIDRGNVSIPFDFFESPYKPLPFDVYERYSLERWIFDVLS